MKTFDKLCKLMEKLSGVVTVAITVFITLIVTVSVITRYCGYPLQWTYEATLVCMSWMTFLGMTITFKLDEQMRLTFVANALRPKTRHIFLAVLDALVFVFLIYAAYLSIGVIKTAMGTVYQTIPIKRGFFYLPFPIGCLFSACQIVNVNYKRLAGLDEFAVGEGAGA